MELRNSVLLNRLEITTKQPTGGHDFSLHRFDLLPSRSKRKHGRSPSPKVFGSSRQPLESILWQDKNDGLGHSPCQGIAYKVEIL